MTQQFVAQSPADMADRDTLLSMSGLEFMQAIRDGKLSGPPIARTMNFRLETVEEGRVVFRGSPTFDHTNPMGRVHGGWYGTILDSAMGCAVMTKTPKGSVYTTLEYKINITRAIPLEREVVCEGIIDHAGRSTGVVSASLRDAETGKLYATGSSTCIIMKMTP